MKIPTFRSVDNTTLVNVATNEQVRAITDKLEQVTKLTEITSEDDAACVKELLSDLSSSNSTLTSLRKKNKKQWLDGGRAVDAAYKKLQAPVETGMAACKKLAGAWLAKCAEAARKLEEEQAKASIVEDALGLPAEVKRDEVTAPVAPVVKTRTVKRLKVTDLSQIPMEYFDLNESKLRKALIDGLVCKGAEIVEDSQVVA